MRAMTRGTNRPRLVKKQLPKVGRPATLKAVLAYENKEIVWSFMDKYAVSFREAQSIFRETKKYLWLIALARHRGLPTPFINDALLVIDEMWHTFLLFTAEYRRYCENHYGFYIDHLPTTRADLKSIYREFRKDPAGMNELFAQELREQLSFIYDELGHRTVVTWYTEYPNRYSRVRLEELRAEQARRSLAERGLDGSR